MVNGAQAASVGVSSLALSNPPTIYFWHSVADTTTMAVDYAYVTQTNLGTNIESEPAPVISIPRIQSIVFEDTFKGTSVNTTAWVVSGAPSVSGSIVTLAPATVDSIIARQQAGVRPPLSLSFIGYLPTDGTGTVCLVGMLGGSGGGYFEITARGSLIVVSDASVSNTYSYAGDSDSAWHTYKFLLTPESLSLYVDRILALVVSNQLPSGMTSPLVPVFTRENTGSSTLNIETVSVMQMGLTTFQLGPFNTLPPSSIGTLADLTGNSAAQQFVAGSTPCQAVCVRALVINAGQVRVGDGSVSASRGDELSGGDAIVLAIDNVNKGYFYGVSPDKVSITYVK